MRLQLPAPFHAKRYIKIMEITQCCSHKAASGSIPPIRSGRGNAQLHSWGCEKGPEGQSLCKITWILAAHGGSDGDLIQTVVWSATHLPMTFRPSERNSDNETGFAIFSPRSLQLNMGNKSKGIISNSRAMTGSSLYETNSSQLSVLISSTTSHSETCHKQFVGNNKLANFANDFFHYKLD